MDKDPTLNVNLNLQDKICFQAWFLCFLLTVSLQPLPLTITGNLIFFIVCIRLCLLLMYSFNIMSQTIAAFYFYTLYRLVAWIWFLCFCIWLMFEHRTFKCLSCLLHMSIHKGNRCFSGQETSNLPHSAALLEISSQAVLAAPWLSPWNQSPTLLPSVFLASTPSLISLGHNILPIPWLLFSESRNSVVT